MGTVPIRIPNTTFVSHLISGTFWGGSFSHFGDVSHLLVGAIAAQIYRALGAGPNILGSPLEGACPLPRIPAAACAGVAHVALRFSVVRGPKIDRDICEL